MNEIIINKLREIEISCNIEILFSCESGSRAWGFPSPDSDFDVRFIYKQKRSKYFSIIEPEDHISFAINDELDIYGWDIKKVLRLISKSNTTPFEWLQSPILYRKNLNFQSDLWKICPDYFNQRGNIHHYLGIAKGALETMEGEEIKIKKLFYVLRPLLAAKWCLEKNSIAPMSIFPLLDLISDDLHKEILSIIKQKETAAEGFKIKVSASIRSFIESEQKYLTEHGKMIEKSVFDVQKLDEFLMKII
jgi:predicted nucleotidyltransferase